ncbi:YciI family protein [Zobellia laminariae]|uniref:YciI family protein n=1 Tax=Zobellia laminariae TaxID=248906 RepID=UPI00191CF44F
MENQKEFMFLFRMEPSNKQPTAAQIATMQKEWGEFIGSIALQAKLVSTSRIGFEGNLIYKDGRIENNINVSNNEILSGNMVVKSSSLKDATEMAKGCPILTLGGSVEVRNVIPMES